MRSSAWRRLGLLPYALVGVALAALVVSVQPAGAAIFTVTKTADTNDGTCDSDCSLREAIRAANAAAGADTITFSPALNGTPITLTLAGSDDNANLGDLDVTGQLTIVGNGQANTIIQAGTTNDNGIDKIFSFNPLGAGSGFPVSMSSLTLRYGKNPETFGSGNGFGGCFDFDSGTSGTGTFSMTSVTVTECQTTQADGGGGAIFLAQGGVVTIIGSTIQNNAAQRPSPNFGIGGGLFFGCAGGSGATLSMSGTTVSSNRAQDSGAQGGGMFLFGPCSGTPTLNYQLHNVTISGNQAANDGGGIYSTAPLTINNSGGPTVISNNSSGRSGGGVWLNHTDQTSTISKITITGNTAADGGGGIRLDSSATGNVLNLSYSRIVNNTAASGRGSGLSVNNGTANADNNWWGCSTGPSAAPCDTAQVDPGSGGGPPGTGTVDFTPWFRVLTTASPSTIVTNQSSSLTASVNTNSNGQDVSANNDLLKGLAVTWSAVGGNLSGQQGTIQPNGTATATYTATAAQAGNAAAAKVDNDGTSSGSNVVSITVNKADTTTTINSDTPDPSVTGQPVTVNFHVTSSTGSTPTAPTGNVTVSDGTDSCTGSIDGSGDGSCNVTFTSVGSKSLTATYDGDSNFNTSSSSPPTAHDVNKADTTTAITSDSPDPSVVGQSVTVQYSVTVNAPGGGIPTGNVTVSDGTSSCTGTVAAGQCSLTFTSSGAKNLTATYAGDANYNGSASAVAEHTVDPAGTTTTITSDSPDPSVAGQAVTVEYNVAPVAPGAGTPTGSVTVTDGVDSCTATVAAGQCNVTLTTQGDRTLTAQYAGDPNFSPSTSDGEPHTVSGIATTTSITSDSPDPSVVGQSVTVQYSVVPSSGSGTPTGNVTVSDGTVSCTGTVATGECSLTFTSAGAKSLTATYAGDATYGGSTSAVEAHTVDPANTTTTITSDSPDPSLVGQAVTVEYDVAPVVPGAGTPTGNVTVTDGVDSCTATVAAGQCNVALTTQGVRTLTAIYSGDSNFNTSTSAGEPHTVTSPNTAPTATVSNGQCSSTTLATGVLEITVFDADGDPLTLTLASNTNQTLVPNANIVLGGTGSSRTLTLTAAAKQSGTATLTLNLSDGNVIVPVVVNVIVGTAADETLSGTTESDMIFGLAGRDTVDAGDGNDLLCGGNGSDTLNGGDGDDILDGQNGDDTLNSGDGDDILRGSSGDDALTGGAGADSFSGGTGADTATDFNAGEGDTQDGTIP